MVYKCFAAVSIFNRMYIRTRVADPHGINFRGMIDAESISKRKIAKEIAIQTICIHNKVIVLDKYTEKNIDIDRTYLRSNVFKNRAGSDSLRN